MMLPYGITVTVERPADTDRYGNPLGLAVHTVEGCAIAPGGSTEATEAAAGSGSGTVEWDVDLLSTDPAADVAAQDTVLVATGPYAGRYSVHGKPKFYANPWTNRGGTLARLKGVSG